MKTKFMAFGLMITALNLTNCAKDNTDGGWSDVDTRNGITHTVQVDGTPWNDDSRSVYEPGVGIHLDGTESLSVYYSVSSADGEYRLNDAVKGTPSGNGVYTFTHPAIDGATAYDYFFMMPGIVTSKTSADGSASQHRIGPVQMPKADSFDPNFDYIAGRPVKGVSPDDTGASVTQFKRIMAPLRLKLMDGAGILTGQKIRQVSLSFDDTTDKGSNKCLSGMFYYRYSEAFKENRISGWEEKSISNTATADYPNGLEHAGQWDTWLMVNPARLTPAGMTITVVSDKMRITRTIALNNKTFDIVDDKINSLSINVTGDGYKAEKAYSADFTQCTDVPASPETSDGLNHGWTIANCTCNTQEGIGNALCLKNKTDNGAITLPALPGGATYKAIYITENTNNTTETAPVLIKQGETVIASANFGYCDEVAQTGGVLELAIPAEYAQGALTIETGCAEAVWINRITVTYEGELNAPSEGHTVGEIYYEEGVAKGVVFWVDPDDANNAKVVSLKRTTGPWSSASTPAEIGAKSPNNGPANTALLRSSAEYADGAIAALTLCDELGEGWYWPAYNELIELFTIYNGESGVDFDKILNGQGGDAINIEGDSGDRYWSSTESNAAYAYCVRVISMIPDNSTKKNSTSRTRYLRCFKTLGKVEPAPDPCVITLVKNEVTLDAGADASSTVTVEVVNGHLASAEADPEASWLKIEIKEGSVVLTTTEANDTDAVRSTVVTLTAAADNGAEDATATLTVSQAMNVQAQFAINTPYEENGKVVGIVFWVSEDGQSAKIVSLDRKEAVAWATKESAAATTLLGSTDKDNGAANTALLKGVADAASTIPMLAFCEEHGEGWYWPAINELKDLFVTYNGVEKFEDIPEKTKPDAMSDAVKAARATFDKLLTDNGGTALNTAAASTNGDGYISSTELTETFIAYCSFGRRYVSSSGDNISKSGATRHGRCIKVVGKPL